MSTDGPPRWRIIAAFFAAPLVSAFAMAFYLPAYGGLAFPDRIMRSTILYCVVGGYPTALVFGVPAFLLLRRRLRPTWVNCTVAGGLIAIAPWLILTILPSAASYEQTGQHVTVLNGVRTVWGWIEGLEAVAAIGVVGMVGGMCFWLVAAAGHRTKSTFEAMA